MSGPRSRPESEREDRRTGRTLAPHEVRRLSERSRRRARRGPPSLARDAAALVRVPRRGRPAAVAVAVAALVYLVAPVDGVADLVPGLGLLDDGAVLAAAVAAIRKMAGKGGPL